MVSSNALAMYELRFALMRLARFFGTLLSIVVIFAMTIIVAMSMIGGFLLFIWVMNRVVMGVDVSSDLSRFGNYWVMCSPLSFAGGVAGLIGSFSLYASCSMPYKWDMKAPGVPVIPCPSCGHIVPAFSKCVDCSGTLPTQRHSIIAMILNPFVTVLWVTLDGLQLIVSLLLCKR